MAETKASRRSLLILVLIIAIPAVPAAIVQVLLRRQPAGVHATPLALDVTESVDRLPKPSGPPIEVTWGLGVGTAWSIETTFTSEIPPTGTIPEADAPDSDFGAALARRGGRYGFSVVAIDVAGALVEMRPTPGAFADDLPSDPLRLRISRDGTLTAESDALATSWDSDAQGALLRATGILIPGPLLRARVYEDNGGPPAWCSFQTAALLGRLRLRVGADSGPPLGGFFFATDPGASPESFVLDVISYRRRSVDGPVWAGRLETVARGRYRAPQSAPWLATGEVRLREYLAIRRDEALTGEADHVIVIRQVATAES